jgi:hypothetical protein
MNFDTHNYNNNKSSRKKDSLKARRKELSERGGRHTLLRDTSISIDRRIRN